MFCKLNSTFTAPIYIVTQGLKTFTGVNGKGIDYKKIWSPDSEKIYNVIPKRYWDGFHLTVMNINCAIPPHTDTEIISTINFYIRTDNCKTTFYQESHNNTKTFQIENQTDGFIYENDTLVEIGSFIAQPNEIWLLDVKQIHGVEPLGEMSVRTAVTLGSFKYNYDEVYEMLRETGNVC